MLFLATFVPRERKGPIRRTSRSGAVEMGESNSPPLVHRCASMYATAPNFWVWYKGMCVGVRGGVGGWASVSAIVGVTMGVTLGVTMGVRSACQENVLVSPLCSPGRAGGAVPPRRSTAWLQALDLCPPLHV